MHSIRKQRWSKMFSAASILAILFGGLLIPSSRAVSANPTAVCVGANCTVTFGYSGDYYLWTPPANAQNLAFDVLGAQGGRSGGLGGRVTGALLTGNTPLFIYVGGAGAQGSGVAGGFNGGGTAGAGRGDEGSGGGASDIRTSTALASRLVVAAGGGGSGGYSGGTGGFGGGTSGGAGTSGQGQAGSGATASSGGNGGFPNGGSWGGNGDLGIGGAGGSSSVSGGGGGGGGYYGGGGGGADVDSCCSNAGGGGGGSSWVDSTKTSSVTNTAGYRSGAGMVIISYSLPPEVTSFGAAATTSKLADQKLNLNFNQSVTGLSASDFLITGATCSSLNLTGSNASYSLALVGCSEGDLQVTLVANSVTGSSAGPAQAFSAAAIKIDYTAPVVASATPPEFTNQQLLHFELQSSEPISQLEAADFELSGVDCSIGAITSVDNRTVVEVAGCADSQMVTLQLKAGSAVDAAGNTAPNSAQSLGQVFVDRTPAAATFATPISASTSAEPSFEIAFDEAVYELTVADFEQRGSATNCQLLLAEVVPNREFEITTSGCSLGSVQLALLAQSYVDAAGNSSTEVLSASIEKIAVPAPPAAAPVTETPTAGPPVAAPIAAEPQSTTNQAPNSAAETQPTATTGPTVSASPESTLNEPGAIGELGSSTTKKFNAPKPAAPGLATEIKLESLNSQIAALGNGDVPEAIDESAEPLVATGQIELDNPTEPKPSSAVFSFTGWLYQSWQIITFGAALLAVIGIGAANSILKRRRSSQNTSGGLDFLNQLRLAGNN